MTPLGRKLLLGFALLGLGASSASSYVHYKLLTETSYTSFCDVNAMFSCTQAYLSQYGSFWGVPVALGGVLFFAAVLLIAGLGGRAQSAARETAPGYIFALSTIGLAFVLYLAWASYFQLKTFCILCAITYVAVIATFIISGGATKFPMTTLPRRAARDLRTLVTSPMALLIALLFVAGSSVIVLSFPRESAADQAAATYPPMTDEERVKLEQWWDVQPKVDIKVPNNGAKVLIVKFSDYMCPACKQTHDGYKSIIGKYAAGGNVRYIVKHYPLEAECNPKAPSNHYASCEAAAAVLMARAKGTAERLEEWIFANQATLTADGVKKAARDIGKIDDFDAKYQQTLQEVKNDADLGGQLGVKSTPTFFINGRMIPGGGIPPQFFDGLIELELKRAK